jgi:hypothetical protein
MAHKRPSAKDELEPKPAAINTDPTARTARAADELESIDLDQEPTVSTGLGIRKGELLAVELLAQRYDVSRNAFIKFCIRYIITEVREGRLDPSEYLRPAERPKREFNFPK